MLGRARRPSLSSLQELELQRPPPKITKTDHFSIYESTLMKLKEGSQRCQSMPLEEAVSIDDGHTTASCCSEAVNPDNQSFDSCHNSSICQSTNKKKNINTSILQLFAAYNKVSRNNTSLPDKEPMVTNDPCHFMDTSGQQSQEKCIDSLVT